ncbi:MAG: TolC family protein, partial [Planctomycetaceae bacterium]
KLPAGLLIPAELRDQLTHSPEKGGRLYWKGNMTESQELLLLSLSNDGNWQRAAGGLVKRMRPTVRTQAVLQLQSRLLASQNTVRTVQQTYLDSLDGFKQLLGLPPNMGLTIDLAMLTQFELTDPRIVRMEEELEAFVDQWAKLDEADPNEAKIRTVLQGLRKLRDRADIEVMGLLQQDLKKVRNHLPRRLRRLQTADERGRVQADFARTEEDLRALQSDFVEITRVLKALERDFGGSGDDQRQRREVPLAAALGTAGGVIPARMLLREAVPAIGKLREALLRIARNAEAVQNSLRVELIMLAEFPLSIDETVKRALENRLDLKNARARVMDARRRVEIAANRLQAVLNLRVEGEINTRPGNQPLDFRGRQSNFRVGIGFTAPLDLVNERNAFRDAQIAYQRERRSYMALEDAIKLSVRTSWRSLDTLARNFETSRRSVRVARVEFDRAVESTVEPGVPNQNPGLTLLNALSSVITAENALIRNWIDYEGSRLNIYRDMGMMEIDSQGLWTDPYYQRGDTAPPSGSTTPPPAPAGPASVPGRADESRPAQLSRLQPERRLPPVRHAGTIRDAGRTRIRSVSHAGASRIVEPRDESPAGAAAVGNRRGRVFHFPLRSPTDLRGSPRASRTRH